MPSPIRPLRVPGKHWKLTAIAVFSLSIAMALGVVCLSVSNTFLLLPPAAAAPDRLVMIYSRVDPSSVEQVSYPDYQFYREHNHVFTDVAAAPVSVSLSEEIQDDGRTIKLISRPVSDNYFSVMGIRPWLGRFFKAGDDSGVQAVAVMTWQCWRRLGSDPKIVGKMVAGSTIVGVAPKEFTGSFYGLNGDLLTSLGRHQEDRGNRQYFLLARLKPGVTRREAQTEMTGLSGQLAAAYPKEDGRRTAVVTRATLLPPDSVRTAALAAAVLLGVVLLVLLIACTNVANLLLAVAVERRQEASIKLALGAPRGRLIREFMMESVVLCAVSGVIGFGVAAFAIVRYSDVTFSMPMYGAFSFGLNLRVDGTVAAFSAVLVLLAVCATGIAPALYASSPNVAQALNGEIVVGGTGKAFRRGALVVAQVAICTVVLIGMGLCERSLYNLRRVDVGFSQRNLIAMMVYPALSVNTGLKPKEFLRTLRTRVAAVPGVEAVALAADLPMLGANAEEIQVAGGKKLSVSHTVVDADYFSTLGIRVLAGRVFNGFDREGQQGAMVVNRRMAEVLWPGEDAVGKEVSAGDPAKPFRVVGVVANGKYEDLDEAPQPFFYYALEQSDAPTVNVIARTHGDPGLWSAPLEGVLKAMKAPLVFAPFTFENWMNLTLLQERALAACAAGLSALGLLLAVMGLYGAISYSVSERKKELGIRIALGARPRQLLRMILAQTARIASLGIAIGVALGAGLTIGVRSQLYQIDAVEWGVTVAVGAGMLGLSGVVAWLSARPWLRTDPMEAVRHA